MATCRKFTTPARYRHQRETLVRIYHAGTRAAAAIIPASMPGPRGAQTQPAVNVATPARTSARSQPGDLHPPRAVPTWPTCPDRVQRNRGRNRFHPRRTRTGIDGTKTPTVPPAGGLRSHAACIIRPSEPSTAAAATTHFAPIPQAVRPRAAPAQGQQRRIRINTIGVNYSNRAHRPWRLRPFMPALADMILTKALLEHVGCARLMCHRPLGFRRYRSRCWPQT